MHGSAATRHLSSFKISLVAYTRLCVVPLGFSKTSDVYISSSILPSLDESLSYHCYLAESWLLLTAGVAVVWKFFMRVCSFNLFDALLILRVVLLCISAMYVMPLLSCLFDITLYLFS